MSEHGGQNVSWVIGAGGLLGSALSRHLASAGGSLTKPSVIPWDQSSIARDTLRLGARDLLDRAAATGGRWRVAWCAGAGVTGTTAAALQDEVAALTAVLDALADQLAASDSDPTCGAVFIASSVGGVYGGSAASPFTEDVPPEPNSAYGRAKLAGEQVAHRFADRTGVPLVIGRISNLYGPGQNLAKPQGLISHLCRAQLTREPITIYVSLDTIRDYLYVEDCADMIRLALAGAGGVTDGGRRVVTKILGSHQGVTIGALLGEFRRVFKRSPQVVLGTSATARYQASDLRVRSVVWPELDHRAMTALPAGIAATAEDLFRRIQLAG